MVTLEDRNRGQLILIGAIVIAFLILGLVVVFNGLLFTQATSSGESLESATDAEDTQLEINRSVGQIVQEANSEDDFTDVEHPNNNLIDRNDGFGDQLTESISQSRSTIVSVNNFEAGSRDGTLIDDTLTEGINEVVYESNEDRELGQFILEFGQASDINDLEIEFESDSGPNEVVTLSDRTTGGEPFDTIEVEWEEQGPGGVTRVCEFRVESGESIEFNLLNGEANELTGEARALNEDEDVEKIERDCKDVANAVRGEYDKIEFNDGDTPDHFEVVIDVEDDDDFEEFGPDNDPFVGDNRPVHWTVEVDYTYDSRETSIDRTLEVKVYGGNL